MASEGEEDMSSWTLRPSEGIGKDSYTYTNRIIMQREDARKIAEETRKTYDTVAGEFSASRATFWGELVFLAKHISRDDRVLDIGCGNGRFFPLVNERHAQYTGIDYSEKLVSVARQLHPEGQFVVGDALALPFPDNTFDIVYSFAAIHHIPSKELRTQFVREAARVLHPGGTFILTAWKLWTPRHFGELLMTALKSNLGRTALDAGDLMLTFGKNKEPRYLHAFTERELSKLLTKNGFGVVSMGIISRPSGEKNIVVVAKKK